MAAMLLLESCASSRPQVPYPAFIQADELPDVFLAALPGVRAKQLAGDPRTRRSSNRLVLPPGWSGTTGASPGKALELYVLFGAIRLGELPLRPGGYAWLPAGTTGFTISSRYGAELLYFLDDSNPQSSIGTPVLYSSEIVDWQPVSEGSADAGLAIKELRRDPGSGARTWLLRVTPEARLPWRKRSQVLEGYLIAGRYRGSECVDGEPRTGTYTEGGYVYRPPGAVHGGPEAGALETAVWLLRTPGAGAIETVDGC